MWLTTEEQSTLERELRMSQQISEDRELSISVAELLNPMRCARYLETVKWKLEAPSIQVAASQFAKRFAFAGVLPFLTALTLYDKWLWCQSEQIRIESNWKSGNWLPNLRLHYQHAIPLDQENREQHLQESWMLLFAQVIQPLWETIHQVSGLSKAVLWENTAIYIYWLYEQKMWELWEQHTSKGQERIWLDFQHLLEAPASIFGEEYQPLQRFYSDKILTYEGERIRFRTTCCMYDQLPQATKSCGGCPKNCRAFSSKRSQSSLFNILDNKKKYMPL